MINCMIILSFACLFITDVIYTYALKDSSFIQIENTKSTVKSVFYSLVMFVLPLWTIVLLFERQRIYVETVICLFLGCLLFVVEFFLLKNRKKSFCVITNTAISAFMLVVFRKTNVALAKTKLLAATAAITVVIVLIYLAYSALKSKVSVFRCGKTLMLLACITACIVASLVIAFVYKSCIVSLPWLHL